MKWVPVRDMDSSLWWRQNHQELFQEKGSSETILRTSIQSMTLFIEQLCSDDTLTTCLYVSKNLPKLCDRTISFISLGDGTNKNLREKYDSMNEMWLFNKQQLKTCVGWWKLMNLSPMTFFRILLLSRNVEIRYEFFITERTKTDLNVLWNANISFESLFIIVQIA